MFFSQHDIKKGYSNYSKFLKCMVAFQYEFLYIAGIKKLNRFTLRGTEKVRTQWLLYCMVHNIGKIQRYSV